MSGTEVRLAAFSDRLRLIAMVGVVAVHCGLPVAAQDSDIWYSQLGKFVDGLFLFVSGYLWQFRGGSTRPMHYLQDRANSLALPYFAWAAVTACIVGGWFALSDKEAVTPLPVLEFVFGATALWFIPQLLLALAVVSWLWRTVGVAATGCLLAVVTLGYGVNLHAGWADIQHSEAPLGFAVFVWLGFVAHDYEDRVRAALQRVPIAVWVLALGVTYLAAGTEALDLQTADSLRVCNIAFTVVAVGAVLALCYRRRVSYREPQAVRGRVYGVYLVHTCVVLPVTLALAAMFSDAWQADPDLAWYLNVGVRLTMLAVVWPVTWLTVGVFQRRGWGRLVGAPPARYKTRAEAA
jgi:fucose 4-O-acetylase-like acetyltransferase